MLLQNIVNLNEMSKSELVYVYNSLTSFLKTKGLEFVLTDHLMVDRLLNDKSRQDIIFNDVIDTVKALFNNEKFSKLDLNKVDFEGIVTNYNTNLNIVFYIGHKKFKLMTAMMSDNFRSGNSPNTKRFGVKA